LLAWSIIVYGTQLLAFLSGYACLMGPIAGILISDFYLVGGWNWRAWLTFFTAVGPILPGFAQSINPDLNISEGAKNLYTFSWMWGITVCTLLYYVICTYVSPPTESFVDVAVFPPRTEEEEQAQINSRLGIVESTSETGSLDKGEQIVKVDEKV
jgi:nucleobase:cation symporter-1, NCS1 family